MDLKKGFSQFMAKFLVWVMIFQGMPLWQISQAYTLEFNRDKAEKTLAFLSGVFSKTPPDDVE